MFERVLVTARESATDSSMPYADQVADASRRHQVTMIVVREKDLEIAALEELVEAVMARVHVPVIVAHRPEVARAVGAAGAHLGWSSPGIADTRRILEPGALIGVSVHGVDEGVQRADQGADYLFFGPVRETPKTTPRAAIGFEPVAALASRVPIPVVAIGGLTSGDLPAARSAGAAGIAAIRSFR